MDERAIRRDERVKTLREALEWASVISLDCKVHHNDELRMIRAQMRAEADRLEAEAANDPACATCGHPCSQHRNAGCHATVEKYCTCQGWRSGGRVERTDDDDILKLAREAMEDDYAELPAKKLAQAVVRMREREAELTRERDAMREVVEIASAEHSECRGQHARCGICQALAKLDEVSGG